MFDKTVACVFNVTICVISLTTSVNEARCSPPLFRQFVSQQVAKKNNQPISTKFDEKITHRPRKISEIGIRVWLRSVVELSPFPAFMRHLRLPRTVQLARCTLCLPASRLNALHVISQLINFSTISQSVNQLINQFNSNLAAREPDSKRYAVENNR